jgi:hypothetical protein
MAVIVVSPCRGRNVKAAGKIMETLRGDKAALGFAVGRFFDVTISGPPEAALG